MRQFKFLAPVLLLLVTLFSSCMMMTPVRTITTTTYENPQWAPPYYSGARYYYIPDLELYYDLSSREYIYLIDGRWHFSPYVPDIYRNYDLDNCFCVVLNVEVYRPWLHHQYYLSHYPRYYYRDYYDHSGIPYVRAYNENIRRAIYWNANERHRARSWDYENSRDNRRFNYSKEDRKEKQNQYRQESTTMGAGRRGQQQDAENQVKPKRTEPTERGTTRQETSTSRNVSSTPRQANTDQENSAVRNNRTNYYGKTIGTSVRVTKQMRDNTQAPTTKSASQRR